MHTRGESRSRIRRTTKRSLSSAMKKVLACLVLLPAVAYADDAAILRCRAIAEASARLSCYDTIPLSPAGSVAAPGPHKATPQEFGLERKQMVTEELNEIESYIPGHFGDVRTNTHIHLANGQVWKIVEGNTRLYDLTDPKVTINRGLLGAYYLSVERDNRTLRVIRLQ